MAESEKHKQLKKKVGEWLQEEHGFTPDEIEVLLISGGVDSACLAYSEQPDIGITVDYGQACADAEVQAAS